MTRRSSRNDIIDWWQAVLDETKDFVDDRIDGCLLVRHGDGPAVGAVASRPGGAAVRGGGGGPVRP